MQRGIKEADGNGVFAHGLVDAFKVAPLHGQQLIQRLAAGFFGLGHYHFAHGGDAVLIEEHMLCTAKANALRAEAYRHGGIMRIVCIGAYGKLLVLVRHFHYASEIAAVGVGGNGGDKSIVDAAGGTVKAQHVALVIGLASKGELLVLFVHLYFAAAGYAAGTHAARNDGRVGGLSAANGQNTLGILHALNVLGAGLKANEYYLLAHLALLHRILGGEHDLARGSSGAGGYGFANGLCGLQRGGVKLRMQQHVQGLGVYLHQRFFFAYHAFVNQVAGNLYGGGSGTLAVTGLQHVKLAVLNGELHVLHVMIMIFKGLADFHELLERFGELLLHLAYGHGGAHAGNDVFALSIGQEFAEEALAAGSGAAGERNAGAAIVAHVAEGHHLHVNGSTPGIGNIVIHAVNVGAGVVPAAENGLDSLKQLHLRVGGEIAADLLLIFGLELIGQLVQVVRIQIQVAGNALAFLHGVYQLFKVFLADFHNNVGEHLYEPSVAVPSPAGIAALGCDYFNNLFVETQVQYGIHHAGHGSARAGTDGDEERIFLIAELLAGHFFHLYDVFHYFRLDFVVNPAAIFVILGAGLGRDGEALGNGQAYLGHFGQVGALTAQQVAHGSVAFAELVNVLFRH